MNKFNLGTSGCESCGSPFHSSSNCTNKKVAKYRFKSREELGLKPGELPFKFRVEIEGDDTEVEIARKRALMRLNASRAYKQMAFAVKAHEASLRLGKWVNSLLETLGEDDADERLVMKAVLMQAEKFESALSEIRDSKIAEAEKIEEILTKSRLDAHRARKKLAEKHIKKLKKSGDFFVLRVPAVDGQASYDLPVSADASFSPLRGLA
jgi:hypothetical protein